jgi:small basic protein (TIGR04137 family)
LARSRNVLKRVERIAQMKAEEKWKDGQSVLGLPKTRVVKAGLGKKKKAAKGPEEGAAAPAGAAATAPAKGAAPAKGTAPAKAAPAKTAAPAKK